ncbi:hypothetical protein [Pararhizobium sp. LjRoot238]|uniref:hypothetical protein n=1 Tax=Pararhizobium sp. LjRoot238 TaxID=3342293 RepID=UPI003ED14816
MWSLRPVFPVTVALKGVVDASAKVLLLLKDDANAYHHVFELNPDVPATVITAAGTYRFTRVAGGVCGMFSA